MRRERREKEVFRIECSTSGVIGKNSLVVHYMYELNNNNLIGFIKLLQFLSCLRFGSMVLQ